MRKPAQQEARNSSIDNLLLGGVLVYTAGKVTKDAIVRHRADRARFKAFLASEQQTPGNIVEVVPEPQPLPQPKKSVRESNEQGDLRREASYIRSFFKTPMSIRKMIPREGIYHAPWAYHHEPTWRSLHHDQSEIARPGEHKTGMEYLVALGEQPLQKAVIESIIEHPGQPWRTLVSEAGLVRAVDRATDKNSAQRESDHLVGIMASIEGMGFDTSDLAFAKWQADDANFAVVPYIPANPLHRIVAAGDLVDRYSDPGLMIRYAGSEYGRDISIDVRSVDIDQLRADKGDLIPAVTPDPNELAGLEYQSPGVF